MSATSPTPPTADALLAELAARVEQQDEKIRRLDATLRALARLPDEPPAAALIDTKRASSAPTVPWPVRSPAGGSETGMLRAALDLTAEAVVGVDAGGAVRAWNAAAARLFGWSAGEVLGAPPPFVPDDKADEHAEMLRGDLADAVTVRRRKDGDLMSVRVTATPAKGGGVVFAFRAADTVADEGAAEPHGPAADRSIQRFATLGRSLAGVAHDFNNLLSVIRGHADLLIERAPQGSADRESAETIAATAELAADVTRRLLSVARPEPGTPHRTDVNGLVAGLSRVLRAVVGARVTVAVTTADGIGLAEVHPADLTQVLLNLAANARDAMPDGGTLTVRTAPAAGGFVVLTAADTGVGMDAATRARMFDPFFTTRDGGTGLGLATVREVVTRAGGHIEVESEPGWGTQVRVYLRQV
jgi:two-component system cell cycle sensor histidine kinase/response regulator CckA